MIATVLAAFVAGQAQPAVRAAAPVGATQIERAQGNAENADLATAVGNSDAAPVEMAEDSPTPAGNALVGHVLYMKYGCYQCHGTVGQGAGQFGPRIAPDPLPYPLYVAQLRRPAAFMPVYTKRLLSEEGVGNIYAYLTAQPALRDYKTIPLLNLR
jgi:cytochrome c553